MSRVRVHSFHCRTLDRVEVVRPERPVNLTSSTKSRARGLLLYYLEQFSLFSSLFNPVDLILISWKENPLKSLAPRMSRCISPFLYFYPGIVFFYLLRFYPLNIESLYFYRKVFLFRQHEGGLNQLEGKWVFLLFIPSCHMI